MPDSAAGRAGTAEETSRTTSSASAHVGWKVWPHSIVKPNHLLRVGSATWRS